MKTQTSNPRPRLGRRKVEALALLLDMFGSWLQVGFVPEGYTRGQLTQARQAADYLARLVAWYQRMDTERKPTG